MKIDQQPRTLTEVREAAEEADTELVRLLHQRAQYPIRLQDYTPTNPLFTDGQTYNSARKAYFDRFYSDILIQLGDSNQNLQSPSQQEREKIEDIDRRLISLLIKRTTRIGEAVARLKCPVGLPVYVPSVEARKLQSIRAQIEQERLGLDIDSTLFIFEGSNPTNQSTSTTRFLGVFGETKRIETIVEKGSSLPAPKSVCKMTTQWKGLVPTLESEMKHRARWEIKSGEPSVKTTQGRNRFGDTYWTSALYAT